MKRLVLLIPALLLCLSLFAQWSTDAANPNVIDNTTSAQAMPKTAVTPEGNTWFGWFNMDPATNNYQIWLQLYNPQGTAIWQTPLLVSSHTSATWLTDWDMTSDMFGNAIMVWQDIRLGTSNAVAYKISQAALLSSGQMGSCSPMTPPPITAICPPLASPRRTTGISLPGSTLPL